MSFTTQKLDWIERVIRDNTVPPLARCVATLIGLHYLNRTSGDAWPSHDQLAAALGVSRSTVKRALNGLVDAGHLHRDVAHGRGHRNHYRPASETENGSEVTPIGQPAEDIKGFKNDPYIAESGSVLTPLPPENGSSGEPQNPFKKENPFKNKNPLKNISLCQ
jgi:DNA-binding transcriptional MocR family regulator